MFEKLKSFFKEKKIIGKKNRIYDFSDEKDKKLLKKINLLDRIKFIKFNSGNNDKDSNVNIKKIKEVRVTCNSSCFSRDRIYKFF